MRPRIGITCRYQIRTTPGGLHVPDASLDARFADLIIAAGGLPLLVPHAEDPAALAEFLELADALILSGGPDIPPSRYGAAPHAQSASMHPRREAIDFQVIELAEQRRLPLLAICLGMQEWNVARGGSLHQHVPDLPLTPRIQHRDGTEFARHDVRLAPGSLLHRIMETDQLTVLSSHHQAIHELGGSLAPTAWSDDGLIEGVEDFHRAFALGLQWHPEDMPDDPLQRRIFQALVKAAADAMQA